ALWDIEDGLWRTVRGSTLRFEAEIEVQQLNAHTHKVAYDWLRDHMGDLPRPGLIYVTRPLHAKQIGKLLGEWGYAAGVYHGETPEAERQQVSRDWIAGTLDFVV